MKWDLFKDSVSHMYLAGTVVVSRSLTQEMAGLNHFTVKTNIFVSLNSGNSVKTLREKIKYFSTTSFSRFTFAWCKSSSKSFFPSSGRWFFSSFKNDWLRWPSKFKFAHNETYWEEQSWHILIALSYWQCNVKLLNLNLKSLQLSEEEYFRLFKFRK